MEKAREFWNKNEDKFKILIDGAFCETIEDDLDAIEFCISEKEYESAGININECKNTLTQIVENEKLMIETVL